MLSELEQMNEQRISPQQLRDKFGVVTEKLDIQTGKPKLGEPFLEPVQSDQVRDWIAEFQPEKEERLEMHPFEFADPNRAHLNELDPSGESIAMKEKIFNYVQCSRDWKRGYILEKQTLWRSFMYAYIASVTIQRAHSLISLDSTGRRAGLISIAGIASTTGR